MARASGKLGLLLLAMSFYLIALIAWMAFEYRRSVAAPPKLVAEVSDLLAAKQYTEAYQKVSADPWFLAKVLAGGVRKLPSGLPAGQRAIELTLEDASDGDGTSDDVPGHGRSLGPMIGQSGRFTA